MKKRNGLKGLLIICIVALVLNGGLLVCSGLSPSAVKENQIPQEAENWESGRVISGETAEDKIVIEPLIKRETKRFLFVGNSMMYYNNLPEMVGSLVRAGTDFGVDPTVVVYSGRTLEEHAGAIAAVIRTKGDSRRLKKKEKPYFHLFRDTAYSEEIYNGYVERIWDSEHNCPRHFDTVILQSYYRNGSGDSKGKEIAESICKVIDAFDSADTTYVVNAATASAKTDFEVFFKRQGKIDKAVRKGVSLAAENAEGAYQEIQAAVYGRAFCNYLLRYGNSYAQRTEPKAYAVYTAKEWGKGIVNDLIYGDGVHPTQLGTYLAAATIYSLLYGDPQKTIEEYRASMHQYVTRVDGRRIGKNGNFALTYRKGKGFRSDAILRAAADIAWRTQQEGLRLQFYAAEEL